MITRNKFDVYKKYAGDIDHVFRMGDKKTQAMFADNNDWSTISGLLQDIFLVKSNKCSADFKEQTQIKIQQTVEQDVAKDMWDNAEKYNW